MLLFVDAFDIIAYCLIYYTVPPAYLDLFIAPANSKTAPSDREEEFLSVQDAKRLCQHCGIAFIGDWSVARYAVIAVTWFYVRSWSLQLVLSVRIRHRMHHTFVRETKNSFLSSGVSSQ
jgi:hypothetical protein